MTTLVFLYSSNCRVCVQILPSIASFAADRSLGLLVRPITYVEIQKIGGVPALVVPANVLGLSQPHVFVGANIPQWLSSLAASSNDRPSNSDA